MGSKTLLMVTFVQCPLTMYLMPLLADRFDSLSIIFVGFYTIEERLVRGNYSFVWELS